MTDKPHSYSRYIHGPDESGVKGKGCRCDECKLGNSANQRAVRARRAERKREAAAKA